MIMTLFASQLFLSPVFAKSDCGFDISTKELKLSVRSTTDDCSNDDMKVMINQGEKSFALKIMPGWFKDVAHHGNLPSLGKSTHYPDYPIYHIDSGTLIFLRRDGRPGYDHMVALLLDPLSHLTVSELDLGPISLNAFGLLKTETGFKTQIVKKNIPEMNCDCDASFETGWLEISVKDGKLAKHWL